MNKTLKRILNLALLLVVRVSLLLPLMRLTARKESTARFDSFFDHAGSYDVLFFGTSHVRDGVFPLELWETYGISAYNCASSGASLPTTYWAMKNALEQAQTDYFESQADAWTEALNPQYDLSKFFAEN